MPERVPAAAARFVGWVIYVFPGARRRVLLGNLHHAFPERSERWRREVGLESCRRMVEMGLFVLASPYFGEGRLRRMFRTDASLGEGVSCVIRSGAPTVILSPHFSLMEALPLLRAIAPGFVPADMEVGIFYRPFASASLERWVKATRERFGMRLLSRRDGFGEAMAILRRNGRVVILFDQHAGGPGALSLFFGRLVSTSELPGILAGKFNADTIAMYVERTAFWRGTLRSERVTTAPASADAVTVAANVWLENKLRADANLCADWLWLHRRWKLGMDARRRFAPVSQRRDVVGATLEACGATACPRRERVWVRVPDEFANALLALPVVRALRSARVDVEVTLLVPAAQVALIDALKVADRVLAVPSGNGLGRWRFFWRMRGAFPDTFVVLGNSFWHDVEGWLARAPQRFGMRRGRWQWRPLSTHVWTPPRGTDARRCHLTRQWAWWLRMAHGLPETLDLAPLRVRDVCRGGLLLDSREVALGMVPRVGFFLGGVSGAGRRWPGAQWRRLALNLLALRSVRICLFGAQPLARAVAADLPEGVVEDVTVAGKDCAVLLRAVSGCRCLVGDAPSALLLGNLLGVPVICLLDEETDVRCGPILEAPTVMFRLGGDATASPEHVSQACAAFCA